MKQESISNFRPHVLTHSKSMWIPPLRKNVLDSYPVSLSQIWDGAGWNPGANKAFMGCSLLQWTSPSVPSYVFRTNSTCSPLNLRRHSQQITWINICKLHFYVHLCLSMCVLGVTSVYFCLRWFVWKKGKEKAERWPESLSKRNWNQLRPGVHCGYIHA